MKKSLLLSLIFWLNQFAVFAQNESPQQSLNQYIEFLNRSTDDLTARFQMLIKYQADVDIYRKKSDFGLRLSSSGPLEAFYYQKALSGSGITSAEKLSLNAGSRAIWQLLTKLDETGKSLETYVRLNAYQDDKLKQSDKLTSEMQSLFIKFREDKADFYKQIHEVYTKYQPYSATDPYLSTEKEMEEILLSQQKLMESLPFYLNEANRTDWPVAMIESSMLADEKLLANFGKTQSKLAYPASAVIPDFKAALLAMQDLKRRALDDHNFAARQSAAHGNHVYLALLNQYNHDLLVTHKSFINYSQSARKMLHYPAFSPIMAPETSVSEGQVSSKTPPFQDKSIPAFTAKKAASPATPATVKTLNGYIDFINESLRQMHLIQVLVRNYQSSAEYYRDPSKAQKRANLTYEHDDFKIPLSDYQLLVNAVNHVPQPYRSSVSGQAEVLLNILKEMDGLSIELIRYTTDKQYLDDHLKRSDEILDRYLVLFDTFDQKKEQLYNDIRRIHESYPNANPASSWYVSGNAMLKTFDGGKAIFFGIKDFLKGDKSQLPDPENLLADSRQLIADEYANMKGLKRYGRSNGLCPYSPYEDLAGNSIRFTEMAPKIKMPSANARNPFESVYYFYNNELVYQYNKFIELSNVGLLKTINQPDLFVFQRTSPKKEIETPVEKPETPVKKAETNVNEVVIVLNPVQEKAAENRQTERPAAPEIVNVAPPTRDTVFVERVRVDTVYVDRNTESQEVSRSLAGFAHNNMVLLLDVSSSMNSPFKMPLLKRSIKSLLTLLRTEDQISIVLYSGKARVVLKPTSGSKSAEISRMIDLLQSDGDTDGNEGIRLAYKTANKQYIRGGNNRIVLATDGEFPVSDEVLSIIKENAGKDLYLSVFTFGRNEHTGQKLRKLSQLGLGSYAHVTAETADLQLILEAQAKKQVSK